MRIKDARLSRIIACLDVIGIVKSYFPEYERDGLVKCPVHDDIEPSFHIAPDGRGFCHGCRHAFSDIAALVSFMDKEPYDRTVDKLYRMAVNAIPDAEVAAYQKVLNGSDRMAIDARNYLSGPDRNLSPDTVERYRIGLEPATGRIVIPIPDQFRVVRNLRRFDWRGMSKYRVINVKGNGGNRLFPEHELVLDRRILLVEGEWDAMVGRQFDLPAVSWTGGARAWDLDEAQLLRGKAVWVLYDEDQTGIEARKMLVDLLKPIVFRLEVVEPLGEDGKDLTDWSVLYPDRVEALAKRIATHPIRWTKPPAKRICPHCGQVMPEKGAKQREKPGS